MTETSTAALVLDIAARFRLTILFAFVAAIVLGTSSHGDGSAAHPRGMDLHIVADAGYAVSAQ